jgi:hypothetical protein
MALQKTKQSVNFLHNIVVPENARSEPRKCVSLKYREKRKNGNSLPVESDRSPRVSRSHFPCCLCTSIVISLVLLLYWREFVISHVRTVLGNLSQMRHVESCNEKLGSSFANITVNRVYLIYQVFAISASLSAGPFHYSYVPAQGNLRN